MDRRWQEQELELRRFLVRKLIHLGKMKIAKKSRGDKRRPLRQGPLLRRILLNSAQMLASVSTTSLQTLRNTVRIDRITVNVGGAKYELPKKNLEKFPDTLLGSERKKIFYDEERMEYFFDRDPVIFKNIAEFYRDGKFHLPSPTAGCMEAILDELKFFGIPEHLVSDCCCEHIFLGDEEEKKKKQKAVVENKITRKVGSWTAREKLWEFLTNSKSSKESAVFGYLFGAVVLLNISAIVAETVPTDSGLKLREAHANVFFGIDSFCVGIFTIEYVARLYSAPQRLDFVREMSNVIDLLGIVPYYIAVIERAVKSESSVLDFVITIFRMFRVFRVTKLARHSERFQTLLMSVQSAGTELGGILFSFLALMVTFSSMMYYFERKEDDTKFISIPAACWYTLVTMTTLGYGDMFPTTVRGKLLGAACALMGVLLLSLPVPIIERKLDEYAKKSKPKKKDADLTKKLAASLPSLARFGVIEDHACSKHRSRDQKKSRRIAHVDSRTTSMVVEVGNSSGSTSDNNTSVVQSMSSESLLFMKDKINIPLIEELPESSDVNGNKMTPPTDAPRKHKSWHGNGKVSAGVGHGIFTESPPSSQYFPVCRHFSSSNGDDGIGQRTRSESFVDDNEENEIIPMKKLHRQWSFDQEEFSVVTPRNCHSVGDLT